MSKFVFTKDTNILEALERDEKVVEAFKKLKLKCTECVAVIKEDLSTAARYHNVDLGLILTELNALGIEDAANNIQKSGNGNQKSEN